MKAFAAFDDGCVEDNGRTPAFENALPPIGQRTEQMMLAVWQFARESGFEGPAAVKVLEDGHEDAKKIGIDKAPGNVIQAGSFGAGHAFF